MTKIVASMMALIFMSINFLSISAHSEEVPCAVVELAGDESQVIPAKGKIETRLKKGDAVDCGSSIITHGHELWIRKKNQNLIRIAHDSFYELGMKDETVNTSLSDRLLRGQILVSGEHAESETDAPTQFVTPNAILDFKNGTTFYTYDSVAKETSVVCFSRSVVFKNRYKTDALQTLKSAEMSHLKVGSTRLVPTQPELVSPSSVKENLGQFALESKERAEMAKGVETEFESRSKSLTADIENWREINEANEEPVAAPAEETAVKAERTIASAPAGQKPVVRQNGGDLEEQTSVDPAEAAHTMDILKKRLYGDGEEPKLEEGVSKSRSPASATEEAPYSDPVYQKQQSRKKGAAKKLVNDISGIE
jgi:hypothetical protein